MSSARDGFPRGGSAIVAAATYGMGSAPGLSTFDLAAHASVKALAQAGLRPRDVDGLAIVVMDETLSVLNFSEYLGIHPRFVEYQRLRRRLPSASRFCFRPLTVIASPRSQGRPTPIHERLLRIAWKPDYRKILFVRPSSLCSAPWSRRRNDRGDEVQVGGALNGFSVRTPKR